MTTREEGKQRFYKALSDFDNDKIPLPNEDPDQQIKDYIDFVNNGLPDYLDNFNIETLWASIKGVGCNLEAKERLRALIEDAIINSELKAEIAVRDPNALGGFTVITSRTIINEIRDGWIGSRYVSYTIHRNDFKLWLESINQYPLDNDCLLSEWFKSQ